MSSIGTKFIKETLNKKTTVHQYKKTGKTFLHHPGNFVPTQQNFFSKK